MHLNLTYASLHDIVVLVSADLLSSINW